MQQGDLSTQKILNRAPHGAEVFSAYPFQWLGFAIKSKQDFVDLLRMRYNLPILNLKPTCDCGKPNSEDHTHECKLGGLVTARHNELRNLVFELARTVHNDVASEPILQPLSGESLPRGSNSKDNARSDVRVRGLTQKWRNAFLDIRVFAPNAKCNKDKELDDLFRVHEQQKEREYKARVEQIEDGDFFPLVAAATGGIGPKFNIFCKLIADRQHEKGKATSYQEAIRTIRCRIAFAIARTAITSLRATRSKSTILINFPIPMVYDSIIFEDTDIYI